LKGLEANMEQQFIDTLKKINPMIFTGDHSNLMAEGVIDSLDVMNIIAALEDNFAIEFDVDDISAENFVSVENIWNLLQKRKGSD
jgi:acyl carrier protein